MTFGTFIKSMNNPLDREDFIKVLLSCYNDLPMADCLNHYQTGKEKREPNLELAQNFRVLLVNEWMNNIINLTENDIRLLKRNDRYKNINIEILQEYVKKIGSVKTYKQVKNYFNLQADDGLSQAVEAFFPLDLNGKWNVVSSKLIGGSKRSMFNIRHNLFVNIDVDYIDEFAMCFKEECQKERIPYEFEYSYDNRRDSLVIYSDNYHLPKYIDLLKRVTFMHPEFYNHIFEPPIGTSVYEGWIGYGSEPSINVYGKESVTSFDLERAALYTDVLNERVKLCGEKLLEKNPSFNLKNGKVIDCQRYIFINSFNYFFNLMKKSKEFLSTNEQEIKESFLNAYRTWFLKNYIKMIRFEEVIPEDFYFKGVKICVMNENGTRNVLRSIYKSELKNNPDEFEIIKKSIKDKCEEYNIYPNNIAIDSNVKLSFLEFEYNKSSSHKVSKERELSEAKLISTMINLLDQMAECLSAGKFDEFDLHETVLLHYYQLVDFKQVNMFDFESSNSLDRVKYFVKLLFAQIKNNDLESYQEYRKSLNRTLVIKQ